MAKSKREVDEVGEESAKDPMEAMRGEGPDEKKDATKDPTRRRRRRRRSRREGEGGDVDDTNDATKGGVGGDDGVGRPSARTALDE